MAIEIGDRDLQTALEEAPPGATIDASSAGRRVVSEPVVVATDGLTVRGLSLALADGANANVLEVRARGVTVESFDVDGNKSAQADSFENSGVVVTDAADVLVRDGRIRDVDRHGVLVGPSEPPARADSAAAGDELKGTAVSDVTVRDVRVDRPRRDGCSVQGYNVENVHVDRVRTFDSRDRGGVEANDGTSHVTIENCYAEDCAYVAAVQDHFHYGNADVAVLHNTAVRCRKLVDTQTSLTHRRISVVGNVGRDLTGAVEPWDEEFSGPGGIYLSRIDGARVADNDVTDVNAGGVVVEDCADVSVTGNAVRGAAEAGISVRGTVGGSITDNAVEGAGGPGVRYAPTAWDETASDAAGRSDSSSGVGSGPSIRIAGNRCRGNDGAGVLVAAPPDRVDGSLIDGNVLTGNGRDGVVFERDGTTGSGE